MVVVEFVNALGTWVKESLFKWLHKASIFSIMAGECTDVTTIKELPVCCCWVKSGVPEEHFTEILLLKKALAKSIVEYCREKNIQLGRLIGMGFDGVATFSGDKTGVQRRLKELSPHALFVHCCCHVLQLASMQAANATPGIMHVYTTLMTLWKFFHYSPKCAESLKEIQKVLDLPELKIVKPSDTRRHAHECCVKAVKASYSPIVLALENIYETSHEPEALGLSKALCSHSIIAAIPLDYILPQEAKFSHALQTKHLDLSLISSLVDATLNSLDATLPSVNWVLQLQDPREELKAATYIEVTYLDIRSFQEIVGKPFIRLIKDTYPASLDPPQKMCYQLPFMETVQFKLSMDSLGEIYQLYHWKEQNLRMQPLSRLTSAQSGKCIVISLAAKRIYIHSTEGITHQ